MSHSWLPAVLREIADEVGLEAALKLAELRGGTEVYIPAHAPDGHWLVTGIGRDAADRVCRYFASNHRTRVDIPLGPTGTIAQARRRLAEAIDKGASETEAVRVSGFSGRTVYRQRAKRRSGGNPGQGSLL